MIPVLSRAQMRAFDAYAIETCRVPSLLLMENAGRGAADIIERELCGGRARGHRVVVVCGTGNNGGDGFVVARHMLTRGARVSVWLAGEVSKTTHDCRTNHDAFLGLGGSVESIPLEKSLDGDDFAIALANADVAIDALFGTGLDRVIVEPMSSIVRLLRDVRSGPHSHTLVAALDVPSGLHADTGVSMGITVEADLTVSFAHLKLGHVTGHGARKAGPVHVVDIGVPPSMLKDKSADLIEASDARAHISKRLIDTHKYRVGHVALMCGSPGKTGAALLAAQGALRGGAGAATILTWAEAAAHLEAKIPEVMVTALPTQLDVDVLCRAVDTNLAHKRSVVIGPGFGTGDAARAISRHVLTTFRGAIVADADTFTHHAGSPEVFAAAAGRAVLTPHSGELARLLGRTAEEIDADRFNATRDAAALTQSVVLLKGAYTVIASPDARMVITGSGSPALATAGAGDVLAGLIGALSCTLPPFEAAWCGAFLHGIAGTAWSKEHGDRGLFASEIASSLPDVIAALIAGD